jgi:hypothetical protein
MTNEQLRMQLIGGILTEGEYKEKLEENKKSLNENIVSIGAINNPFPKHKKSDYELAFEHFTKDGLNEEEVKEATLPPSPDENSSIIQLMRNLLASGVAIDGVPTDIENVSDEELYKIAQQYMMKQTHSK